MTVNSKDYTATSLHLDLFLEAYQHTSLLIVIGLVECSQTEDRKCNKDLCLLHLGTSQHFKTQSMMEKCCNLKNNFDIVLEHYVRHCNTCSVEHLQCTYSKETR